MDMNIDFYISSLSGGGAENVLITLAKEFQRKGNHVSITSLEKRPQFYEVPGEIELIKYDHTEKGKLKEHIDDFLAVRKQIKNRQKTDVCISFLSRCNWLVLICSFFLKSKVVVCDRNNPLKEHSKAIFWLSCQLYRSASAIVVQTVQIKNFYPKFLQNKIHIIENPLDEDRLIKQCAEKMVCKENLIISMGRLEKQKDFKTLINAFAQIEKKFPEWNVCIFGKGDMKNELQELINKYGLESRIFLRGRTETPFLELKKAKVFVLSSNYEGFPNVLCEGLYAGLACVSSDCISGPKELITDGVNGFLFPVGDAEALSDKLTLMLSSEELRAKLGKNGKTSVKKLFLPEIIKKWDGILRTI